MVWHTIAKNRPTDLCFWMLLTKYFKSFTHSIHHVVPLQFHCISISSLTWQPCSSQIRCLSFILWLMTEIISEQQKSITVAFTVTVNTEGFLHTFFLNMILPASNYTAKFLNNAVFFMGIFGKLHSTFLAAFTFVLLDLYAQLLLAWGGEISSCILFCQGFCCSIFLFSRCCAFSSVLIFFLTLSTDFMF